MSEESSNNGRLPNGQFAVGNSGGPGRPRNRINAVAAELDQLALDVAAELVRDSIDRARKGDPRARAEVLKRVWPTRRNRPVEITPAAGDGGCHLLPEHEALTKVMMNGEVTPQDAEAATRVLDALYQHRKQAKWLKNFDKGEGK